MRDQPSAGLAGGEDQVDAGEQRGAVRCGFSVVGEAEDEALAEVSMPPLPASKRPCIRIVRTAPATGVVRKVVPSGPPSW